MSAPRLLEVPAGPPLEQLAAALPDGAWPALLQSGPVDHELGRWSYLAFEPRETLSLVVGDEPLEDPARRALPRLAAALERQLPDAPPVPTDDGGPPFRGGAVAVLGYDLGRQLERLPVGCPRDLAWPDLVAGIYPWVLAEERASGRRVLAGRGPGSEGRAVLARLEALAREARPLPPVASAGAPTSTFERPAYEAAVAAVRERILDGDVYQVNLSQRFAVPWEGRPESLLAALQRHSPAPFAACLRGPHGSLVSSSPELFLRRRGTALESRPIKGTRPRGRDAAEDARLLAELESDAKERAELSMIVDLVRNDLGRSASLGTVAVDQPFDSEAWATVFHRVARVTARVPADLDTATLIERAWPPASVTGTPKLSALGVIEALEPVRRHAYTGALGWLDPAGDCDLSVAIRIATHEAGRLAVNVGGGITLASDPAAEYEETLHKARGWFSILGLDLPPTRDDDRRP